MAGESIFSRGEPVSGDSREETGWEKQFLLRIRGRVRCIIEGNRQNSLEPVSGEHPNVFQLLQQLNDASSLQEARESLINYRSKYGEYFVTPRFLDNNGNPMRYDVRDLLLLLNRLIEGENIPLSQIPRPIRDLYARLDSSPLHVKGEKIENYVECTDQSGKSIRIPLEVVERIQSEQGVQLSRGSRIMYGEGYKDSSLIGSERKAIDQDSIRDAIMVGRYYWIIPNRVSADRWPIVIRVTPGEYSQLYAALPQSLRIGRPNR